MFVAALCSGLPPMGATRKRWLEWILRCLIAIFFGIEGLATVFSLSLDEAHTPWSTGVFNIMTGTTGLALVRQCRVMISWFLSAVEYVCGGQLLVALIKRKPISLAEQRIFSPLSVPHMMAFFIYMQAMGYLLGVISPQDMGLPNISMPIPLPLMDFLSQLFTYNGLGLVILSFCGVGVFVARKPRECMKRLGWEKPTATQVGIGILLVFGSFLYDYIWSVFGSGLHQDLGGKLAMYNAGTFAVLGGFTASVILATATALCAGVGEETLIRGALQPVFGIVPAGYHVHGALHGQFAHAPIFIIQVAGWSCLMGVVRKYTNTTTTIIGHAGFNFVTATFLFAFNP